jgi:hypothetical protein
MRKKTSFILFKKGNYSIEIMTLFSPLLGFENGTPPERGEERILGDRHFSFTMLFFQYLEPPRSADGTSGTQTAIFAESQTAFSQTTG